MKKIPSDLYHKIGGEGYFKTPYFESLIKSYFVYDDSNNPISTPLDKHGEVEINNIDSLNLTNGGIGYNISVTGFNWQFDQPSIRTAMINLYTLVSFK